MEKKKRWEHIWPISCSLRPCFFCSKMLDFGDFEILRSSKITHFHCFKSVYPSQNAQNVNVFTKMLLFCFFCRNSGISRHVTLVNWKPPSFKNIFLNVSASYIWILKTTFFGIEFQNWAFWHRYSLQIHQKHFRTTKIRNINLEVSGLPPS